jgi:hypothetical protein
MAERTVKAVFVNYTDEDGVARRALRGGTVTNISEEEADRLAQYGAWEGVGPAPSDAKGAAFPNSGQSGGVHSTVGARIAPDASLATTIGPTPAGTDPMASELSDDQVDALTGDDLQSVAEQLNIDTSTGGSLQDGSMSADEKRAAIKAELEDARTA